MSKVFAHWDSQRLFEVVELTWADEKTRVKDGGGILVIGFTGHSSIDPKTRTRKSDRISAANETAYTSEEMKGRQTTFEL